MDTIQKKLVYWEEERCKAEKTYGRFSRMVSRCSAIVGGLRLLRDHIQFDGTNKIEAYKNTIQSYELIALPCYWDVCKELRIIMLDLLDPAEKELL